jgi:hypothetical protein
MENHNFLMGKSTINGNFYVKLPEGIPNWNVLATARMRWLNHQAGKPCIIKAYCFGMECDVARNMYNIHICIIIYMESWKRIYCV